MARMGKKFVFYFDSATCSPSVCQICHQLRLCGPQLGPFNTCRRFDRRDYVPSQISYSQEEIGMWDRTWSNSKDSVMHGPEPQYPQDPSTQ